MTTELKAFLWFNGVLDEALEFYRETFNDVQVYSENRAPDGKIFTADFSIYGHNFIAMNWPGGPQFNDAISLSLNVDSQEEVDRLWSAITLEGREIGCGWCADKFGLVWQVSPKEMRVWLEHEDEEIRNYANEQLRSMKKIVVADLHK
jgi:predicted 3-demethylubiquinone-9 3-methyltransferase (glyoxalase superfamily)